MVRYLRAFFGESYPFTPFPKEGVMSQRLLLLAFLIIFSVLPAKSQFPVQVATSDMPEATALNNGHKLAVEGWPLQPARLHAVFTSANDVFHSFSMNLGSTWSSPVNVSQTSGPSRYPAVAWDSLYSALFAVWQDSTSGRNQIYCSSYQGNVWSAPVNVSNTPGQAIYPALEADRQGRLHLVYADNSSGNYDIYYQRYESGSWTDTVNLSRDTGRSDFPSLEVYRDDVYVCWQDTSPGYYAVLERRWNGSAWSPASRLSRAGVNSYHPSFSCPGFLDFGPSLAWIEADTVFRFYGAIPGGGGSRTHPCFSPVVSSGCTTQINLGWQEQDTFWIQIYYKYGGGPRWYDPVPVAQGRYPSIFGDNYLFTRGLSSPYQVMYWASGYLSGAEVEDPVRHIFPLSLALRPNPSPGCVTVSLSLPQPASLLLEVYDLQGAVVRTLARTTLPAGRQEFLWDGRDDFGHKVPSGVYLLRASAGSKSQTARVLLLR